MREIKRGKARDYSFAILWILSLALLSISALFIILNHQGFALKLITAFFGISLLLTVFYIFKAGIKKKDE